MRPPLAAARRRGRRRARRRGRRARDELRAVRDHEHRPSLAEPRRPPRRRARGALGVEVGGRLVEDHERRVAEERPGERDPPRAGRPRAGGRRRRPASRSRPAARARSASAPASDGRLAHALVGRAGGAEPDVVGDRAAEERRPLRHPRDAARATRPASQAARSTPPTVMRPAGRLGEPQQQRGERALARAARPDERDRLAGRELEVDAVEHRAAVGRVGERDALEPDGAVARARRGASRSPARPPAAPRAGRAAAPATAMPSALAWNCAPRLRSGRYSSGASTSTVSAGLEADAAVDEPDADRDRDERDPERRRQLEHGAREERDPERAHRRAAVLVADARDRAPPGPRRG